MRDRRTLTVACWVRVLFVVFAVVVGGCAALPPNSFIDPTAVGHFPSDAHEGAIRRVLSPRETPPGIAGASEPTPEDLVPIFSEYRIVPGDILAVSIRDLLDTGVPYQLQAEVSELGEIRIPDLGVVKVAGLTEAEVEMEIGSRLKEARLLPDPVVVAFIQAKRGRVVTALGAVAGPGTYPITRPDLRLLDFIGMIGDTQATIKVGYIIRDETAGRITPVAAPAEMAPDALEEDGWVIPPEPINENEIEPYSGLMTSAGVSAQEPPAGRQQDVPTREELDEVMSPQAQTQPTTDQAEPPALEEPGFEPIVIFDPQTGEVLEVEQPAAEEWPTEEPAPEDRLPVEEYEEPFDWEDVEELALEQRVIRINLESLKAGDPRQNVVMRDRDVFHVPVDTGVFYMMGEISRPGVYSLGGRDITVKQAIATAGGFTPLAWPSRCELIRREPGTDKQFTRVVNLDAIFAGLEDDFYLRDDDILNVGTHIVAPFLFVIRNSFRFTYGFGFVYDRNFADKDAYSNKINPEIYEQQRRQQRGLPF